MRAYTLVRLILLTMALGFLNCTKEKIAGPATDAGNPVLTGFVIDTKSKPVYQARINVYRAVLDFDSILALRGNQSMASTTTKPDGSYAFPNLPNGKYFLEGIDSIRQGYSVSAPTIIDWGKDSLPIQAAPLMLKRPGKIMGKATRGGILGTNTNLLLEDGFIQVMVLEINRDAITRQDGSYQLENLPEGVYTLAFYAPDGFFTAYKKSISVSSGGITPIETVKLERIPWLAPPKPKQITAIFDSAQRIVALKWSSVQLPNLAGYIVERREDPLEKGVAFATQDTVYWDDVKKFPAGTEFYYVVRAVNKNFTEGANEGPVKVNIP